MPPIWRRQSKCKLPRFSDGTSYLYLEHTIIEINDRAIQAFHEEGMIEIPAATLGVLLLGPGTSISHAAVRAIAEMGCSMVWVGEEGVRFYASGTGKSSSSKRIQRQAQLWANPESYLRIARRMYELRSGQSLPNATIQQLRGYEGQRVAQQYENYAALYRLKWNGRKYDRKNPKNNDPANNAINCATECLYGLAHAAIVSCGYSPALGFIHSGKSHSLVYDIADLYKGSDAYRIAFSEAAHGPDDLERRVRLALRDHIRNTRLLRTMANDLLDLFDATDEDEEESNTLYDPDGNVPGGTNYGK